MRSFLHRKRRIRHNASRHEKVRERRICGVSCAFKRGEKGENKEKEEEKKKKKNGEKRIQRGDPSVLYCFLFFCSFPLLDIGISEKLIPLLCVCVHNFFGSFICNVVQAISPSPTSKTTAERKRNNARRRRGQSKSLSFN